ncbi:Glucose-1-phosphate adenylyltransferase [Candidatus Burkholderia brachyanthoides]|nr:Glucose-1-phosphate adenylyltransferase [Candidatus Burkholderia brachyanthoides]
MHFGDKYRIIDFALSNCLNSGIRRIAVVTQYKAHSPIRHLQRGWGFLRGEFNEFIDIWPAQQRIDSSWYRGTADAVYQNLDIVRSIGAEFVVVLVGDYIYNIDYTRMVLDHVENGADCTVGCIGHYVFSAKYLYQILEENIMSTNTDHNFGKDIIPRIVTMGKAIAHPFSMLCVASSSDPEAPAYWRDVGTVDAYWSANLDLASTIPEFDLYDRK